MQVSMRINGQLVSRDVEPRTLLVHFIRDTEGLTGTHWGCDTSNCGVCTVTLDGVPVKSCTVLAVMADGKQVGTVEGMERADGLDPVQQGFVQCHGLQCGFCTPGMIMASIDIVKRNGKKVSEEVIRRELSQNICRCTGYHNIVAAVQSAAEKM